MQQSIPLTDMTTGETGSVVEIAGGRGVTGRLQALGIRPGVTVTKVSAHFTRGPVVVQIGGTQAAVGFGISHKIIVEVNR